MDAQDLSRLAAIDFGRDIENLTKDFIGREWVFREIDAWLDRRYERFFILTGKPGVGKSAIAARLTQVRADIAAHHFCIAGRNSTVVPSTALRSLAAQLGDRLPGYGQALANTIKPLYLRVQVDIDVRSMTGGQIAGVVINRLPAGDPEEELDILFRAPLAELAAPPAPVLILVDSLDEAVTHRGQVNLVTLLAEADDLPSWVRFLCTSRPEQRVLRSFDGLAAYVLAAESHMNLEDFRRYVYYRAADDGMPARLRAADIELRHLADRMAELANGNFLYAKILLNDVEAGLRSLDDPEALPQSLDEIYHGFLTRFTVWEWKERFQPLLSVLAVAQEPVAEALMADFSGLWPAEVRRYLGAVEQYLELEGETYALFHQSLRDYLLERKRSKGFWCAPEDSHKRIAHHYWSSWDRRSYCDLYGLRHLPVHLMGADEDERLRALLLDFNWLQAKLEGTDVTSLIADYDLLPADAEAQLVGNALCLSAPVLARDQTQLPGQLWGRLQGLAEPGIQSLAARARLEAPWMRQLRPGLTVPGGPREVDEALEQRLVNAGFAPQSAAAMPVSPDMPLGCGRSYYFWLEVGSPLAESIEVTLMPLPTEDLPPEWRLEVALFALQGADGPTAIADTGELELLPNGEAQVARQPAEPPIVLWDPSLPQRRLFFPLRAPDHEGVWHLRCTISYEQIVVQSLLVQAQVMAQPQPIEGALLSVLEADDYQLAHTIHPAHLARLSAHRLSLLTNRNGDGSHSFFFLGKGKQKPLNSVASLDGPLLQDVIGQARGALRRAAWGDEQPWQGQAYRYDGPHDFKAFKRDLVRLAIRGHRFYDTLINRLVGGYEEAEQLAELMQEPGLVQVAIRRSARYLLPALLFYDYPLDPDIYPGELDRYIICPAFRDVLDGPDPLEECECFQGNCPSRGKMTHVCPSGFWGYRHFLGMPLSESPGQDTTPEIGYHRDIQFDIGVSTDPDFTLRSEHEEVLQKLHGALVWNYAATRSSVIELLQGTKPHLVYFYCHGGVANNLPYLLVGPRGEPGLTRPFLRDYKIRWKDTRPLVFINGCKTAALTPDVAMEFVSAFVENAAASAVIGTEITIFEPLAGAFAEEFLRRFLAGVPIGEAMRSSRLALLKAGNPLGLVYIPFALASLRLVEEPDGV